MSLQEFGGGLMSNPFLISGAAPETPSMRHQSPPIKAVVHLKSADVPSQASVEIWPTVCDFKSWGFGEHGRVSINMAACLWLFSVLVHRCMYLQLGTWAITPHSVGESVNSGFTMKRVFGGRLFVVVIVLAG